MTASMGSRQAKRRAIVKMAALSAGAGSIGLRANRVAAADRQSEVRYTAYAFYPLDTGRQHRCRACSGHAEHRRFATHEAATGGRAHKGCDCSIVTLSVTEADYIGWFGGLPGKELDLVADLRWSEAKPITSPVAAGGLEMPVARTR